MNPIRWWFRPPREREQVSAEAMIRRSLLLHSVPSLEIEPGLWSIMGDVCFTYRPAVFLSAVGAIIHCNAGCEIIVERELLPRELLLLVLEENAVYDEGAYRLVPQEDRRILALRQVVDSRHCSDEELARLALGLLRRMQLMATKLYALGLVISGPVREADQLPPYEPPHHPPWKRPR